MNRAALIAVAACAVVIGGLGVLAAPAIAATWAAAAPIVQTASAVFASPSPSTSADGPAAEGGTLLPDGNRLVSLGEGVSEEVAPGECTEAVITNDHRLLGTLVDQGVTAYAHGTVVYNGAGKIKGYKVASGDTLFAIGARFCMSDAVLMYANRPADWPQDTGYTIQPGQVLILDPGA